MERRTNTGRAALTTAILAASFGATPADTVELYRRMVPLETTTGVVTIRKTVAVRLDVPEKCEDGSMECAATRRFAGVYRIGFEVETRKVAAGGDPYVEREPRGTAWLALGASREDDEGYDERLRAALARLGAASFDEPFAGMRADRRPFDGWVAEISADPSWACFEDAGKPRATVYTRKTREGPDGTPVASSTGSATYPDRGNEFVRPLCSALESATSTAFPEEMRTMSTPRLLRDEVLRVEVRDDLLEEAHPDELLALPEGAELGRRRVPGVERSTHGSVRGEVIESALAVKEVETRARLFPAALPPLAARDNAWHSRWTFEAIERRLGPLPGSRLLESWSLTASLIPTFPPRDLDREGEPPAPSPSDSYPVRMEADALFESVAGELDFRAALSPKTVAETIVHHVQGLGSPGWVLVLCLPDGSATWGLPPTTGRSPLLNAGDFCGAVESYIP